MRAFKFAVLACVAATPCLSQMAPTPPMGGFRGGAEVRDVWKQKDLGHITGVFTDTVPTHGVTLLIGGR